MDDDSPKCDKCGAEITTGMMAMFCPAGQACEFWVPEMADFMAELGMTPPPATAGGPSHD